MNSNTARNLCKSQTLGFTSYYEKRRFYDTWVPAAEQQACHHNQASGAQLTTSQPRVIGKRIGTIFEFQGTLQGLWEVRCILFVDGPKRMYRIVFDPTSTVNEEVLSSLQIDLADGDRHSQWGKSVLHL